MTMSVEPAIEIWRVFAVLSSRCMKFDYVARCYVSFAHGSSFLSKVDNTSILSLPLLALFSQLGCWPLGSCPPRSRLVRSDFVLWHFSE
jgi:hypothetical protein